MLETMLGSAQKLRTEIATEAEDDADAAYTRQLLKKFQEDAGPPSFFFLS